MLPSVFALLLQAAPYMTGPAAQAPPTAYRAGEGPPPSYNVAPGHTPPVPELARTGVNIDAYDRRVEGRWGAGDPFYDGTVLGGAAVAQSRQGDMDGSWNVAAVQGEPLYSVELVDTGQGLVEGAWRAGGAVVGSPSGLMRSGFITMVSREAGRVTLWFLEPRANGPTAVRLERAADGSWRGELTRASGSPLPVVMRRR